jgi:hypothetical protein
MAAPPKQAEASAFLQCLAGAAPVETHISLVFVGRDAVWKLKKAVRLAFLDFSDVEARRRFSLRELELNQTAAQGMYRDVVPLVRRADGSLALGEEGEVLDWVLRMARVPRGDFLDEIAAAGRLTPELLDALGDAVAEYHRQLPTASPGAVAAMRHVTDGNARSALDAGLPSTEVAAWQSAAIAALEGIAPWLAQREQDGFVRRAHGDLHLGNLCLWQGKVVPFDALEFDEAMATIDLGYDLAFLLMDLDQRVGRTAANRVMNRYVARTGDAALTRGLPLFLSLRAMVRAHVEAKRGNGVLAARYLAAAAGYLQVRPAVIVAVGGLPGTGKSTVARAVAPALGNAPGALILRSDEIRKRQHGAAPEERLSQGAYAKAASEAVFEELARLVQKTAAAGHSVIADATFIDAVDRTRVEAAALSASVRFVGVWLEAPMAVLENRIGTRRGDASDATLPVLHAAAQSGAGAGTWNAVDAASTVDAAADAVWAVVDR